MTGSESSRVSVQAGVQAPAQGCEAVSPVSSPRDTGPPPPASAPQSHATSLGKASSIVRRCLQLPGSPYWLKGLTDSRAALWWSVGPAVEGRSTRGGGQSPLWIPALQGGGGGKSLPWSGTPTNPLFFCPQFSSQAASWPLLASSPCGTLAHTPCILPP